MSARTKVTLRRHQSPQYAVTETENEMQAQAATDEDLRKKWQALRRWTDHSDRDLHDLVLSCAENSGLELNVDAYNQLVKSAIDAGSEIRHRLERLEPKDQRLSFVLVAGVAMNDVIHQRQQQQQRLDSTGALEAPSEEHTTATV